MSSRSTKVNYSELAGKSSEKKTKGKAAKGVHSKDETALPENDVPASNSECASCNVLANLVRSLLDRTKSLEKEVAELKEDISVKMPGDMPHDSAMVEEYDTRLKDLEEKVEARTNRQLRQTMVLRKVPELDTEKTWSDTRDVVALKIAALLGISIDEAQPLINRCHCGGNPTFYKGNGRIRPIYINFMRWDTCEKLVDEARKQSEFSLDYKFGPLTTIRRNQALKLRKELKRKGEITKAFIKFPAKLMGKKDPNGKYEVIHDFSKDDVASFIDE